MVRHGALWCKSPRTIAPAVPKYTPYICSMLHHNEAVISRFIIHGIGNALQEEGCRLAGQAIALPNENLQGLLLQYFYSAFKEPEYYTFWHDATLALNDCYSHANAVFTDNSCFVEKSQHIARHLYEQSNHPKVKPGELLIALLDGGTLNGEEVQALAIFKMERKEDFLQIHPEGESFVLEALQGQHLAKADKGCIIFNVHGTRV